MSELFPDSPSSQQNSPLINPDLKTPNSLAHLTNALRKTMELANSSVAEKSQEGAVDDSTNNDSASTDISENK